MTVEEMKNKARVEKRTLIKLLMVYHKPKLAMEQLESKNLKVLRNMWDRTKKQY